MSRPTDVLWAHGAFAVLEQGVRVRGTPTMRAWSSAFRAVATAKSGVQWATGDLLLYADGRGWSEADIEAVMDATGQKRGTLANLKAISRVFPKERRVAGLPWSHHALVASLPQAQGDALLRRALEERWGWEELRAHARESREANRREAQTWPDGTFGLIYAGPPWGAGGGRARRDRLATPQLVALAEHVKRITAPDCVLYLWVPTAQLLSGEFRTVLEAWDFTPRAAHVWVQDRLGQGPWARERHLTLVVATHGDPAPPAEDRVPDSVVQAPRRDDVPFPEEAYAMLEHCYAGVPRVELFATAARPGWVAWGGQLGLPEPETRAISLREEAV